MWTCPKCKEEVEDEFDVCWACGTTPEGVEDPAFDPEREGMMREEDYQEQMQREGLVTLSTYWSAPEAHMVRSCLAAEGIDAVVTDELATTMTWGLLSDHGGVKVQVAEKDLPRARQVLAQAQRDPGEEGPRGE